MGALMRSFDWASSPLGAVEQWPQSLRTAVSICINSRFPIVLWWGKDLRLLYNDAWRPVLGNKHPALTQAGRDVWPEIWHIIGPMLEGVLTSGTATWSDDQLLVLERAGFPEEAYFTYSYSPIRGDDGRVGGVFAAVNETTLRVLGERRLRTLRDLGAQASLAKTAEQACQASAKTLAENPEDVPFAAIYLLEPEHAELAASYPFAAGHAAAPARVGLAEDGAGWPLAEVARSGRPRVVGDVRARFGHLPGSPWPQRPEQALVLPLRAAGHDRLAGLLVVGVSPCLALDADYLSFFELAAGHIATAVANARAYEEERRRAQALAELDQAKTVFFSNVSHEFRTPLTLMLGPLETMAADESLPPATREELELVRRNSLRLLKLVNTLLDFSRIEAGRVEATYEQTDLAAATADLASTFRSAVETAGLAFDIACEPGTEAFVDRDMWEKVVLNLLSNAFKFTLEGRIAVRLRRSGDRIQLQVEDTGVGIPAEELPNVFKRFHRVRGVKARTHEGSGIGLALVHELVKLHGGEVQVESEPGRGTTFTVSIPAGDAHLPRERLRAARQLASTSIRRDAFVEEAMRWLGPTPRSGQPVGVYDAPTALAGPTEEGPRPRVLVADDNADMRGYVARLLADQFEVQEVADGAEALAAARARRPDLVLTDVMMPNLDGFGLLRALRSDAATAEVPVVMLSARAGEEARVEGLRAGADDYLTKPFSARELVARVDGQVRLARMRTEMAQARRAAMEELSAARARMLAVLEALSDGFAIYDKEWRLVFCNETAARIMRRDREELLGKNIWESMPEAKATPMYDIVLRAMAEQRAMEVEEFYAPLGVWVEVRLFPTPDALSVYFRDVTQRKRAEEELRQANDRLQELDRLKTQFLNTISHELRTPLTPMALQIELVQARGGISPAQDRSIEVIRRNLGRLTGLVSDMVDVSRIQSGRLVVHPVPHPLDGIVHTSIEAYMEPARKAAVALSVAAEPGIVVAADADRVEQVLANLVSNALKFTPPGGSIEVRAERVGDVARIAVRDTGRGMTEEQMSRLFRPFSQVHEPSASTPGTGLGLYICKGLVESHHGRLWAASEGPGKGATFTFELPLAQG